MKNELVNKFERLIEEAKEKITDSSIDFDNGKISREQHESNKTSAREEIRKWIKSREYEDDFERMLEAR